MNDFDRDRLAPEPEPEPEPYNPCNPTRLLTAGSFLWNRGPWRWGATPDVNVYSPGDYSHVQYHPP